MKKFSLNTIFITVMTIVFGIACVLFVMSDIALQKEQSERAKLEEARIFTREMQAVWDFMDLSQDRINYTEDGEFEFKGLHCAIVGRSVGTLFSAGNDYKVRYTNFNPRNIQSKPDKFETKALKTFNNNPKIKEYYGIADYEGEQYFRYLQALKVDQSCLKCHGSPAGELDVTGYQKEGWTLDTVGGAISIIMPLDETMENIKANTLRNIIFFIILMLLIGGVFYAMFVHFVVSPVREMRDAFAGMNEGKLKITLEDRNKAKEVSELNKKFNEMSTELHSVYENLEAQVNERTLDLQEANRELEDQKTSLKILNDKLAKETRFKSDILSMVNHELRTPLTSIITIAQISKEDAIKNCDLENKKSWEEIENSSLILLNMINDMLESARLDAGELKVSTDIVDLGDVVSSVKTTIEPLAKKYKVRFTSRIEGDVPLVWGDVEKIVRIIENLTSNAIKFTPDGGKVALLVTYDKPADKVFLKVMDTGIGIAKKDQKRIFDRFVQVDSTSTRKYNGSGLGLTIAKEHAEMQGFSLTVESELNKGTIFTVTIPSNYVIGDEDE